MSREVRRVPLDFDWPLGKVWGGYVLPDTHYEIPCPDCTNGYAPHARHLYDQFYGKAPFDPASTGSQPLHAGTPAVRERAERNVAHAPEFYGTGEAAIVREARRLAALWDKQWGHHLDQDDAAALAAANRLRRFTHTWTQEAGWQPKDPPEIPTAEQVNEWSIRTMGHDAINVGVLVRARCEREGHPVACGTCDGRASTEAYPGQRAEAEAWEPTQPPKGDGWQLWSTVSEGSPISPVFPTSGALAMWMSDPDRGSDWVPADVAAKFITVGWAPTLVSGPDTHGPVSGIEWIGTTSTPTSGEDHPA